MKILYCNIEWVDYGLDTLYDGLCRVLGSENVLEYPAKPSLHGTKFKNYAKYPAFFDYPETKTDEEKVRMLKNGKFDVIFIGCGNNYDFGYNRPQHGGLFNLLKKRIKKTPIYMFDYSDAKDINYLLAGALQPKIYFKREYLKNRKYEPWVTPLSFSYSEKYIPKNINTTRHNTCFWVGGEESNRKPFLYPLRKKYDFVFGRRLLQNDYSNKLLSVKIGINLKGRGNDTVRYYEIPAHGALLFSEKLDIVVENEFKDGETAIYFNDPNDMKKKLDYCIKNDMSKIAKAGREWLLKFHTSRARAEQVLRKL